MRLNLNQQSSGETWFWHKNLIDSLIPIVDCGVHYVDVMCQLTDAKPVRVHGIGPSYGQKLTSRTMVICMSPLTMAQWVGTRLVGDR